ncbi:MAG TPA: GTPase [Acidimicrobiia bacterium]|nr:GTPase [Acidimicrobiia bacterium]
MTANPVVDRLAAAAVAATDLGLAEEASSAQTLVEQIERRLGFSGDVYVMALAGGTGVGKSSVLNTLAGESVSPARAIRPTTEHPLAWVANDAKETLAPLLDWLGISRVVGHDRNELNRVAILDLPDFDSIRTEHRATVDSLLPRIDAVAWVVDPEKYDDERLHEYLRSLAPHAKRMRFIFNKADRLTAEQRELLTDDLRRRLTAVDLGQVPINVVSAADDLGFEALRNELMGAAEAKTIVAAKLATDADREIQRISRAVGLDGDSFRPLLSPDDRSSAVKQAVAGALAIIDPRGVSNQVEAAVLHRARRQGGSLLARIVVLLSWLTGQRRRAADPVAFLLDWRRRGTLGHILNPVRAALVRAAGSVPPPSRPMILKALGAETAEAAVTRALDTSTREATIDLKIKGSWLWAVVGFLQLAAAAVLLFAVAWYLTIIFGPGGLLVETVDLPYLGPVPMPLVLLTGSLALSILLGFVLSLHAGWIGRRLGAKVAARVATAVEAAVISGGFSGLDRVEDARSRIANAR